MALIVATVGWICLPAACTVPDEPLTRGVSIRFRLINERTLDGDPRRRQGGRRCRV